MDLEHTNLGGHCEAADCNQRDFLPFKCDVCQKKLCLVHRSYAAHSCIGVLSKDITSIECPICFQTVKFSKSDNPDVVWDSHYVNSCTKEPGNRPTAQKCYKQACRTHLGPSNSIECRSCRQKVCIAHRNPEDHECKGIRGAVLSKLPPSIVSNASKLELKSSVAVKSDKASSKQLPTPLQNLQMSSVSQSPSSGHFSCPFCGIEAASTNILEKHVVECHPEHPQSPPPAERGVSSGIASTVQSCSGREVCPICQARFLDPVDLVSHFEQVHPSNQSSDGSSSNDCIIC